MGNGAGEGKTHQVGVIESRKKERLLPLRRIVVIPLGLPPSEGRRAIDDLSAFKAPQRFGTVVEWTSTVRSWLYDERLLVSFE